MFEGRSDDAADDAAVRALALLDLLDESELLDAECVDDEWWREAPVVVDVPASPDVVLTAALRDPVSAATVVALSTLEPAALDARQRVDAAVAWDRVANHAQARIADLTAADVAAGDQGDLLAPAEATAAEFGAALRLSDRSAHTHVEVSTRLATRFPETLAAVRRGDVSIGKAGVLALMTTFLDDDAARAVEQTTLPRAAGRTFGQHRAAVRGAVDRIDPVGADERRRRAKRAIRLLREHCGDGMAELFAFLPSEEADVIVHAADTWARRQKAAGDERTLDRLRVAALHRWAVSFLHHGDSGRCDEHLAEPGERVQPATPPRRHGRPAGVRLAWSLAGLLGVRPDCGELTDSGTALPPGAMAEIVARGLTVRRLLVEPATGELVDLTPRTWRLLPRGTDPASEPPTDPHGEPYLLGVVVETWLRAALVDGVVDGLDAVQRELVAAVAAALEVADPATRLVLTELLRHRVSADELDAHPDAYRPSARLADFVATRDGHPTTPTASPTTSADAVDQDHVVAFAAGGRTVRDNLASPTRRWHRLKTVGGWTVRRLGRGWEWRSPTGRTYRVDPYDYRLGP